MKKSGKNFPDEEEPPANCLSSFPALPAAEEVASVFATEFSAIRDFVAEFPILTFPASVVVIVVGVGKPLTASLSQPAQWTLPAPLGDALSPPRSPSPTSRGTPSILETPSRRRPKAAPTFEETPSQLTTPLGGATNANATHNRKTKAKLGVIRDDDADDDNDDDDDDVEDDDDDDVGDEEMKYSPRRR